jgi:hypothetical protein
LPIPACEADEMVELADQRRITDLEEGNGVRERRHDHEVLDNSFS